eukprot:scaffold3901_cov390-Prasinococcus_capsulatus_cf.AAC.8
MTGIVQGLFAPVSRVLSLFWPLGRRPGVWRARVKEARVVSVAWEPPCSRSDCLLLPVRRVDAYACAATSGRDHPPTPAERLPPRRHLPPPTPKGGPASHVVVVRCSGAPPFKYWARVVAAAGRPSARRPTGMRQRGIAGGRRLCVRRFSLETRTPRGPRLLGGTSRELNVIYRVQKHRDWRHTHAMNHVCGGGRVVSGCPSSSRCASLPPATATPAPGQALGCNGRRVPRPRGPPVPVTVLPRLPARSEQPAASRHTTRARRARAGPPSLCAPRGVLGRSHGIGGAAFAVQPHVSKSRACPVQVAQ